MMIIYCGWCSRTLSSRYNGFHPSCVPLARAAGAAPRARGAAVPSPDIAAATTAVDIAASSRQPILPSISHIHTKRVPVLKFVPKQLRGMWAQCVSKTMASTAFHNDMTSWAHQQMLAKCVLCAPARSGQQHVNQRVAFTRHRLQRWLDGDRAALWQDIPNYKPPKPRQAMTPAHETALKHQRCDDLCREGADSNACKALYSPGLLDPAAAFDEMFSKHPTSPNAHDMARLGAPNMGVVLQVDADATLKSVKSFNKHSGAGPLGMRTVHLKQHSPQCTRTKLQNTLPLR